MSNLKIYKYKAPIKNEFVLDLPEFAQVLTVQVQYGEACIWAAVDLSAPVKPRTFHWAGTGEDTPTGQYVGTVQFNCPNSFNNLVYHLFEER